MNFNVENFIGQDVLTGFPVAIQQVLPEFSLLCLATMVLLIDAYLPRKALFNEHGIEQEQNIKNYKITYWLSNLVLIITFLLVYSQISLNNITNTGVTDNLLNNMITNDSLSYILKLFMIGFVLVGYFFSVNFLNNHKIFTGEYFAMGLFSLLGMMVLVSSQNLLTLYLGLELFSLPVYAMIAMQRKSVQAGEAALKYFVMGAIASGVLLFGMSIVYGLSGSLVLSDIANNNYLHNSPLILGLVFICVGIAFKFGAAPFHMWMPDVYEGAPTPTTLFIATAPKLAAFGMAMRLLNEGFAELGDSWGYAMVFIALLSVIWGNIAAVAQTNLKRLLAYSGISHMGFIILGLVAASSATGTSSDSAYAAGLFYTITYGFTSLIAFGFILMLGNGKYELANLNDYKGLYQKNPWLAMMLMILLFSMAGAPPFVGFFAKMAIVKSLVATENVTAAVCAVLFTVIGAYYYIRLVWLMFFEQPVASSKLELTDHTLDNVLSNVTNGNKYVVSVGCLSVLALGIYSQWLFAWCLSVFS